MKAHSNRYLSILLLLLLPLLTFCGFETHSNILTLDKYTPLEEQGPLTLGQSITLKFDDSSQTPIYRIAAFQKNTVYKFSSTDVNFENAAIFLQKVSKANDSHKFKSEKHLSFDKTDTLTLPVEAAYRIRFISKDPSISELKLKIICIKKCGLAQQNLRSFLSSTQTKITKILHQVLPANVNPKVFQTLQSLISESKDNDNRLVVPLGSSEYTSMLELWSARQDETGPNQADEHRAVEVTAMFDERCQDPVRPSLLDIKTTFGSKVQYNYPADWSIAPCVADHSPKVASLMMDLVNNPNKKITYNGLRITSVDQLLAALIKDGNTVEVLNEKMYADFLAFSQNNSWLQLPLWIDTGFKNPKTQKNIQIPMGHSQHTFVIRGPSLTASVSYFLGMFGTGYFPNLTKRAEWTGFKRLYRITDEATVLKLAKKSQELMAELQRQSTQNSTGPFADGYVIQGVCNDSNGVLEMLTQKYMQPHKSYLHIKGFSFPYSRQVDFDHKLSPLELDELFRRDANSTVTDLLAHIPRDFHIKNGIATPTDRLSIFCRILDMNPFPIGTSNPLGTRLQKDIDYIRSEVGDKCPKI